MNIKQIRDHKALTKAQIIHLDDCQIPNTSGDQHRWVRLWSTNRMAIVTSRSRRSTFGASLERSSCWRYPFNRPVLAGGGIMSVAVRHNSQKIWTASDYEKFDLNITVVAEDTIDFVVYGGYGYRNAPISENISY